MWLVCGSCCPWLVAPLVLAGVTLAGCTGESPASRQKPPDSSVTPIAPAPVQPNASASPQKSAAASKAPAPPPATTSRPTAPESPIGTPPKGDRSPGARSPKTFAVYFLSRGSGVPAAARAAQEQVQSLVDGDRERGVSVSVETKRIGIEGERRLCVTYENAGDGSRALERVRAVVAGVDLVRVVEEPCTPSPGQSQKKEDP